MNAAVLKTVNSGDRVRGFESLPLRTMANGKYTVFVLRCLRSGTHTFGLTKCFADSLQKHRVSHECGQCVSPEILHLEQHDTAAEAHARLNVIRGQLIRHAWQKPVLAEKFPLVRAYIPGYLSLQ